MIIKMSVNLTKGFALWKEMVHSNADKAKEHGFRMIFAGTEADNNSKLHVIMEFESAESLESFKNDSELAQRRLDAGADLESVVATPMSGESFSNFPA
jgi:uncharacterized protein (DUF1330 family)